VSVEERRVFGQVDDDFEYWARLAGDKRVTRITREIERQVDRFAYDLEDVGFEYTSTHVFPFDKRTIGVMFGEHPESQYSFTISLEDIEIDPEKGAIRVPVARVYRWRGEPEDPERQDFKEVLRKDLMVEVEPSKIGGLLRDIYNEVAQKHGLPLLK